jgi:hypothetical protein
MTEETRDLIVGCCLDLAHGEPGQAVAWIYYKITDTNERRRAVNRLWRVLGKP